MLAASLLAQETLEGSDENGGALGFKCAVFICAYGALDSRSAGRKIMPRANDEVIRVPAANIVGSKDLHYEAGVELYELCDTQSRKLFDHGGHEVRRGTQVTADMAEVITAAVDSVLFAQ